MKNVFIVMVSFLIIGCIDREALDSSVQEAQNEVDIVKDQLHDLNSKMEDLEYSIDDLISLTDELHDSRCTENATEIANYGQDVSYYYYELDEEFDYLGSSIHRLQRALNNIEEFSR